MEVLAMGGYAAYVWPSFLTAGIIMLAMAVASIRALKRAQHQLNRLQHVPASDEA